MKFSIFARSQRPAARVRSRSDHRRSRGSGLRFFGARGFVQSGAVMLAVTLAGLGLSRPAESCGPSFLAAIFSFSKRPGAELDGYARGELGLVQPSFARSYLTVAYRYFADRPLSASEQEGFRMLWNSRLGNSDGPGAASDSEFAVEASLEAWRKARRAAIESSGAANHADNEIQIDVWRRMPDSRWQSFLNCTPDAFRTAAETLAKRAERYGARDPRLARWIAAQDRVFANCGGEADVPEDLPAGAEALERADRAYQQAAARFYNLEYDAATRAFAEIAQNNQSPWAELAPLLEARSRIRSVTVAGAEPETAYAQAAARLETLQRSADNPELKRAAGDLLAFIRFRQTPVEQLERLATGLGGGGAPGESDGTNASGAVSATDAQTVRRRAADWTLLLDRYAEELPFDVSQSDANANAGAGENGAAGQSEERAFAFPPQLRPNGRVAPPQQANHDLIEWISVYQSPYARETARAVRRWNELRAAGSGTESGAAKAPALPWLVAVVARIHGGHPQADAALAAAEQVAPEHPAHATLAVHRLRLLTERDSILEARALFAELAANDFAKLPDRDAQNAALAYGMLLAETPSEAFARGLRQPAGFSFEPWAETWLESPAENSYYESLGDRERYPAADLTFWMNARLPIATQLDAIEAANAAQIPVEQRREILRMLWTRAALLGRHAEGDRAAKLLLPLLANEARETGAAQKLSEHLSRYLDEKATPDQRSDGGFVNRILAFLGLGGASEQSQAGDAPTDPARAFGAGGEVDPKRFVGVFAVLELPGLTPYAEAGLPRMTALDTIDNFRDNWWCEARREGVAFEYFARDDVYVPFLYGERRPLFLTEEKNKQALGELELLTAAGAGPDFLCGEAIRFAQSVPEDPRVPKALHRCVKATRFGCTTDQNGRFSKAAFQLLHDRYPQSEWTEKTPYWFD